MYYYSFVLHFIKGRLYREIDDYMYRGGDRGERTPPLSQQFFLFQSISCFSQGVSQKNVKRKLGTFF
jgi:hypothetical protein